MKNVKIVSTILFYITRVLAIGYILVTIYSFISLVTGWQFVTMDDGLNFAILYPFTETHFLVGKNDWGYQVFSFLVPIGFFGVFLLLASNVFKAFKQPKLFTIYGLKQLKWFWIANIFVPGIIIFLASIFAKMVEEGLEWIAVIHFFLGVFAFFLYAIFKQGVNLQNEQDLYI